MSLVRRGCASVAVLAVASVCLSAQQGSETIPKEILSLLRMGPTSGGPAEIKVGPAPSDFPSEVLPRGTVVAASQANDKGITVVGTLAGPTGAWRNDYMTTVSASGWASEMPVMRGFTTSMTGGSASVCKGTDFVSLSLLSRKEGGVYVRAALTHDPRRVCMPRTSGSEQYFADVVFPTLEAPPNSRAMGGGGGGSTDEWTSHSKITTDLSIAVLAEHYRRQISEAGWIEDGPSIELGSASITRYKVPSKLGLPIFAMFVVTAFDAQQQFDLFLRVIRPSDRGPGLMTSGGLIIK